jgi:rare lipoprotein A
MRVASWRAAVRRLGFMAALGLAGCASAPHGPHGAAAIDTSRDGPEASPPAGLEHVPDAEPRVEPIRVGGPNKPYEALGRSYVPMNQDAPYAERGLASWYGRKFNGKPTSSGEPYDMYAMTAAHPTLPIPSYARVRNPANGREVIVRVNDRGPFHPGRIIDLSYTAALKLDLLRGVAPVEVERITFEEIRAGTWRRAPEGTRFADAANDDAAPRAQAVGTALPPGPRVAAVVVPSAAVAPVGARGDEASASMRRTMPAGEAAVTPPAAGAPTSASTAPVDPGVLVSAAGVAAPGDGVAAVSSIARGFWVQLGAFRDRAGALAFQREVGGTASWLAPRLVVVDDAALFRLQAGPYATRDDARGAADGVRAALSLVPVIVERR